jgi:hypothetical protein
MFQKHKDLCRMIEAASIPDIVRIPPIRAHLCLLRVISRMYKLREEDSTDSCLMADKKAAWLAAFSCQWQRPHCDPDADTATVSCVPESRWTFRFDAESVPAVAPDASPASITPGTPVA